MRGGEMKLDGDSVDYVLVWKTPEDPEKNNFAVDMRRDFENELVNKGLIIKQEEGENGLNFVLITAPQDVLRRYAEIMKLRMPIHSKNLVEKKVKESKTLIQKMKDEYYTRLNKDRDVIFKEIPHKLTAVYSRGQEYLFHNEENDENFFSEPIRTMVVDFILERIQLCKPPSSDGDDDDHHNSENEFSLRRLIMDKVYEAAYPLHDGEYNVKGSERNLLYDNWAPLSKWIMHQPFDHIKEYFGPKFGLYFAWLGLYTHMLIFAALVGLACFMYGLFTVYNNTLSEDICNRTLNIVMCPLCNKCDFWKLDETCKYARLTYLVDNPSTIFFAIFMAFWSTIFLEMWKRCSAGLTHHWGLNDFDLHAEHPRPAYLAALANSKNNSTCGFQIKTRMNTVTGEEEPGVSFWTVRVPFTVMSFTVVLIMIAVTVIAVFGVVLYRMSEITTKRFFGSEDKTTSQIFFMQTTAAIINLACIMLLNVGYDWLAAKLTEIELLRTQTQFDNSLTLKIYLFQFVNYYASIFYIAFIKGKLIGYPAKYNHVFKFRQEECSPGGCVMELCIQLAIIMVGKQALNSVMELVTPWVKQWWMKNKASSGQQQQANKCSKQPVEELQEVTYKPWLVTKCPLITRFCSCCRGEAEELQGMTADQGDRAEEVKKGGKDQDLSEASKVGSTLSAQDQNEDLTSVINQCTSDLELLEWDARGLFSDYLEMVLQYGFVTIFVAAFPLAPLFALINNVLETRLDAKKFLTFYRRPVAMRVKDIGVWFRILEMLGRISVITNAFIIAFNSNFIPQLVYRMTASPDHSNTGYLNHSLSYFDTKDFQEGVAPASSIFPNVTICRYAGYRNPPWDVNKYKRPSIYWHILAARLAFVVVFQNVVSFLCMAMQVVIPDVPGHIRDQIREEAYLTNKLIMSYMAKNVKK